MTNELTPEEAIKVTAFGLDRPDREITRTSLDWADRKDLFILDADGWNRSSPNAFDASWGQHITEKEFDRRAAESTVARRSEMNL